MGYYHPSQYLQNFSSIYASVFRLGPLLLKHSPVFNFSLIYSMILLSSSSAAGLMAPTTSWQETSVFIRIFYSDSICQRFSLVLQPSRSFPSRL